MRCGVGDGDKFLAALFGGDGDTFLAATFGLGWEMKADS